MSEPIALFKPVVSDSAIEAVGAVLRSGWLGTGPVTAEFESAFARYCGSNYCVGTSSGTDALLLALEIAGVQGREVITPALTYVATAGAIVHAGGVPVFADIDVHTGNLDPASVTSRVSERTAAIMVVHYAGLPADLDELRAIASSSGLRVIEDCAHAVGATYKGRRIGGGGDLHAFSLHATKNLTAGAGGALLTDDADDSARARRLRSHGVDRESFERVSAGGPVWDYEVSEIGHGCAMTDVPAALALAQLTRLDAENGRRAEIAGLYRDRLAGVDGLRLLDVPADRKGNDHLFVILAEQRDTLIDKLAASDITAGVHYRRIDSHSAFESADLPATEWFWRRAVSLPMHLALSDGDVERVCAVIGGGW
ncbi:MAG TPA: DegT/DnrJ/EryC1/StrS family aminotransferase [Acidimicrobiales bacterium]|nr:DegT/DnrJ/EryC1/StrS family aminotransferase [Acidimicrobiales bacterium]